MITQTSLDAYNKLKHSGKLNESQQKVYDTLKRLPTPQTAAELQPYCYMPINCVTPRLLELRTLGLVVRGKRRVCGETGEQAYEHYINKA